MKFDIQVAEKIIGLVGEKVSSNPIVIEDLMIIQSLSDPERTIHGHPVP